jgi:hypothetical protein
LNLNPWRHEAAVFADVATMTGLVLKWAERGRGARLKTFGTLDYKIAVLAHINGLYKTAPLKVNIGCVSVGSVQSRA